MENIRATLPIAEYLLLIHQGITTGQVPILTPEGRPTGEFTPLDAKERMALLKGMVDKALPTKIATPAEMGEAPATLDEIQKIASSPEEISQLSLAQLDEMEAAIHKAKQKDPQ